MAIEKSDFTTLTETKSSKESTQPNDSLQPITKIRANSLPQDGLLIFFI